MAKKSSKRAKASNASAGARRKESAPKGKKGGKRPGAGRPSKNGNRRIFRLGGEIDARLVAFAEAAGISLTEAVELALDDYLGRKGV